MNISGQVTNNMRQRCIINLHVPVLHAYDPEQVGTSKVCTRAK